MNIRKIDIKKLRKNKKGSLVDIIVWIVIGFVTVTFLALWTYGFDKMTVAMGNIDSSGDINFSKHVDATFGVVNNQMSGLQSIAFIIMFTLAIGILLTNFFVKAHPVFFILYILIIVIAVIFAVNISNIYMNTLLPHDDFGSTFQEFKGASFIMEYLPLWTIVIGFLGALFLFAGIMRDRELGGGSV